MADHAGFDPPEVFVYRGNGSIPRNVRWVEVDPSVKFIPDRLFKDCWQLESVALHEGLLKIGKHAFERCYSLWSIQIPSTVAEIGTFAFHGCSNLDAVDLPDGLKEIADWTFADCTSLEDVRIPASVARIGASAFRGCSNLASIDLREGLRRIGDSAFAGCRSLESLRVPSSVDEIGGRALDDCRSLALVQLPEDLPRMARSAFRGCPLDSFQFAGLSERMEAMCMDIQMKSMFDSRLSEISLALRRSYHGECRWAYHDETGFMYPMERRRQQREEEAAKVIWEKCKESLRSAQEHLTYLELNGAAPLLELALWKAKIEGLGGEGLQEETVNSEDWGQDMNDAGREEKRTKVMKTVGQETRLSHEDYHVKCGADFVLPEVLKFFAYSSSWPQFDD